MHEQPADCLDIWTHQLSTAPEGAEYMATAVLATPVSKRGRLGDEADAEMGTDTELETCA